MFCVGTGKPINSYPDAVPCGDRNIVESFGYFAFQKYVERGNQAGFLKSKTPLINKVKSMLLHIPMESELYKQYIQIPFLTPLKSCGNTPLKVVWVEYAKSVDLQYVLVCSGVKHFIVSNKKATEAVVDIFLVRLEDLFESHYSFTVPTLTFTGNSSKYVHDISGLTVVGTHVATSLTNEGSKEYQSLPYYMKSNTLCDSMQYVCSLDYLRYVYTFIYGVSVFPTTCFAPSKCESASNIFEKILIRSSGGLEEAIEKIWGDSISVVDCIAESDFIMRTYSDDLSVFAEGYDEEGNDIVWGSVDDWPPELIVFGEDYDEDFC